MATSPCPMPPQVRMMLLLAVVFLGLLVAPPVVTSSSPEFCADDTVAARYKPNPSNTDAALLVRHAEQDAALHAFLADRIPEALDHTGSAAFDEHLKGVQSVLRFWNASNDLVNAGLFHSIYGTEGFIGFSLPLSYRDDVKALIGERAERLAWIFCMCDRYSVDRAVLTGKERKIVSRPELGRFDVEMTDDEWWEFLELTLADWLEQVEGAALKENVYMHWKKGEAWSYRRSAYRELARLLSEREPKRLKVAEEMFNDVFAVEPEETRDLQQPRTAPNNDAVKNAYEALRAAGEDVPVSWAPQRVSVEG